VFFSVAALSPDSSLPELEALGPIEGCVNKRNL